MTRARARPGPWAAVLLAGVAGCAGISAEAGHDKVSALVAERTGHQTRWDKGPPDDARIAQWVREATDKGLTRARAVEIALVNNPELQTTYEDLGISQADMVQAGLLKNPSLGAELGFRINSGANDELRLSLVQDFLDIFVLPLRKQIAREQFETDTLRVADRALEVAAQVERDFVALQTNVELVAFRKIMVDAAAARSELSQRQSDAGNISALERQTEQATYEQAKLDLAREELSVIEARERINRLLGLWGHTTSWRLAETLPPLPPTEAKLEQLESLAMRQRLDVAVARRQAALLSKAVDLARSTRMFGRIDIGVDMHRDPNGPLLLGPNLVIDLPIFDQRQALIARLEAQHRQQERRLAGVAIDARSEVRLAQVRLAMARQTVVQYRDVLLPLRQTVAAQALLHYNGMFIGLHQLILAKQDEWDAQRGLLESLRAYWNARVDLGRALGGNMPTPPPPMVSPPPQPAPEGHPIHEH